ncbi:MAG: DUF1800 domain-containing protein [Vicinamibacterales bacterium]
MKVFKAITFCAVLAAGTASLTAGQDDEAILHVLGRIGFGARPGDVDRVRAMGLEKYIASQLSPSSIPDEAVEQKLSAFQTLDLSSSEIASRFYTPPQQRNAQQARQPNRAQGAPQMAPPPTEPGQMPAPAPAEMRQRQQANLPLIELSQQKLLRAVYSERQLEEVLVDFWFNHFNVFAGKGQFARFYLTEYEREAIRPHVLGNFREMLGATAESPAMLWYLDNWMSAAPEMNPVDYSRFRPGARRRTGNNQPGSMQQPARPARGLNENYGRELLELHTLGVDGGYTQKDVIEVARAFTGWTIEAPRRGGGDFTFNDRIHDKGEKIVLGHRIPANGGRRDGELVLDIVARHPSTAKHIARKLVTRFVCDTPPPALVDRVAKVFLDSDGDLKKVTRAIVTSPEFMSAEARRAKVKTPFEFVVSAMRATGADVRNAAPLVQQLRTLGMPLYGAQPPTGYSDRAVTWVNSGALINRMNFAVALVANRLPGTRVAPATVDPDTVVSQDTLSPGTRATVAKATDKPKQLVLLLGSPEFQKR